MHCPDAPTVETRRRSELRVLVACAARASEIIDELPLFKIKIAPLDFAKWCDGLRFRFAVALAEADLGRDRQPGGPARQLDHQAAKRLGVAEVSGHFRANLVMNVQNDRETGR